MSDWELVSAPSSTPDKLQYNPNEWELVDNAPSDNQSFLSKLPRNIAIGLTHAGRSLHNLPYETSKLAEWPAEKLFGPLKHPLSSYLPHDVQNYADVFGQTGNGTFADKAIQTGLEFAPDIISGANALKGLRLLPHLTKRGASKNLKRARQMGIDKNIDPLNVNPELIEDMRQYLPADTLPYRKAMDEAHKGKYQDLFDLQSTVGSEAASRSRALFDPAMRSHGKAGLQARRDYLNDMHRALQEAGHPEISNALKLGQEEYRRYIKFKPYRNALIAAGVAAALPKNALINLVRNLATINNH